MSDEYKLYDDYQTKIEKYMLYSMKKNNIDIDSIFSAASCFTHKNNFADGIDSANSWVRDSGVDGLCDETSSHEALLLYEVGWFTDNDDDDEDTTISVGVAYSSWDCNSVDYYYVKIGEGDTQLNKDFWGGIGFMYNDKNIFGKCYIEQNSDSSNDFNFFEFSYIYNNENDNLEAGMLYFQFSASSVDTDVIDCNNAYTGNFNHVQVEVDWSDYLRISLTSNNDQVDTVVKQVDHIHDYDIDTHDIKMISFDSFDSFYSFFSFASKVIPICICYIIVLSVILTLFYKPCKIKSRSAGNGYTPIN